MEIGLVYRLKDKKTGETKLLAAIEDINKTINTYINKYSIEILDVLDSNAKIGDLYKRYDKYKLPEPISEVERVLKTEKEEIAYTIPEMPKKIDIPREKKNKDESIICECGGKYNPIQKKRHDSRHIHQQYLKNNMIF